MKKLGVLLVVCFAALQAYSQGSLAVREFYEQGRNYIALKWLSPGFVNKQGVNVYRQEVGSGDWQRITAQPVVREYTFSQADLSADPELADYKSIIDGLVQDSQQDNNKLGIIKVALGAKAVTSEPFARYLGIRFDDESVQTGKSYQYRVNDAISNKEIATSDVIAVSGNFQLLPPVNPKIEQVKKSVHIGYKAEPYRYFGVNIYRASGSSGFIKITAQPIMFISHRSEAGEQEFPEFSYEDVTVEIGNTYRYILKAVDYFGIESNNEGELAITVKDPTKPARPEITNAKADETGKVTIDWAFSEADPKEFTVLRAQSTEDVPEVVATIGGATRTLTDAPGAGVWYYRVIATNFIDNSESSDFAVLAIRDQDPPLAPQNLVAEPLDGEVKLRWQPVVASDLAGYAIYQSMDKGQNFERMNAEPLKEAEYSLILHKSLKNDIIYVVVALDISGNASERSNAVTTRLPDSTPPAAPFLKMVTMDNELVQVLWQPSADQDVAGYYVFRQATDEAEPKQVNINVIPASSRQFNDRTAIAGQAYTYWLKSVDDTGNTSALSNNFEYTLAKNNAQILVSGFEASWEKRKNKVVLKWTVDANDIKGVMVYRKESTGMFMPQTGLLSETGFSDTKTSPDKVYEYQLRVFPTKGRPYYSEIQTITIPSNK